MFIFGFSGLALEDSDLPRQHQLVYPVFKWVWFWECFLIYFFLCKIIIYYRKVKNILISIQIFMDHCYYCCLSHVILYWRKTAIFHLSPKLIMSALIFKISKNPKLFLFKNFPIKWTRSNLFPHSEKECVLSAGVSWDHYHNDYIAIAAD